MTDYLDYWVGEGRGQSGDTGTTYRQWRDGHWEKSSQYWIPGPGEAMGYTEERFGRIRESAVPEWIRRDAPFGADRRNWEPEIRRAAEVVADLFRRDIEFGPPSEWAHVSLGESVRAQASEINACGWFAEGFRLLDDELDEAVHLGEQLAEVQV